MGIKLFLLFVLAFALSLSLPDGFEKGSSVEVDVVSAQKAEQLFEQFKTDTEIPFNFPLDGCYARATAMARISEAENINMGKVWATGVLRANSNSKIIKQIEWGWHVAPILHVKGDDGETRVMVFDPSLYDRPVTVEEWTAGMQVKGDPKPRVDSIYYGSRFQYWTADSERKKSSWVKQDLLHAKMTMEKYGKLTKELESRKLEFRKTSGGLITVPAKGAQ